MECLHGLPAPVAQGSYPLFVNREDAPAAKLPESIGLRGFNTRGYTRPGHELSKEGRELRDRVDAASNESLSSQGCTVIGRHSAQGTGLKGAVSAVEHEAFSANYRGYTRLIEKVYGTQMQRETLCLPSLSDGMVLNSDTLMVSNFVGGGPPLFTTIDHLCVNPRTCYQTHHSSLYAQLVKKQQALTRESAEAISKRLEDQIVVEHNLYKTDPEQHPDGFTNALALQHLQEALSKGLGQALHVVSLDPLCDQPTRDSIVEYLERRVLKDTAVEELPVVKFVGVARVPRDTAQEDLETAMLAGHDQLFNPRSLAEAVVYRGEVPQGD